MQAIGPDDTTILHLFSNSKIELTHRLGEGAFGVVYRAIHPNFGIVALKVLKDVTRSASTLTRFVREARIAGRLDVHAFVRVHEFQEIPLPHIIMEFVEGEDLETKVLRDGALPLNEAVSLVQELAQGMSVAHKRDIIHRDLKPSNILIDAEGQAKIADLGLAGVLNDQDSLRSTHSRGGLGGTRRYMPQEQYDNFSGSREPADVFALGLILAFVLSGDHLLPAEVEKPFWEVEEELDALQELFPTIPNAAMDLMRKATQLDPADRFPDATVLSLELGRILRRTTGSRPSTTASSKTPSPSQGQYAGGGTTSTRLPPPAPPSTEPTANSAATPSPKPVTAKPPVKLPDPEPKTPTRPVVSEEDRFVGRLLVLYGIAVAFGGTGRSLSVMGLWNAVGTAPARMMKASAWVSKNLLLEGVFASGFVRFACGVGAAWFGFHLSKDEEEIRPAFVFGSVVLVFVVTLIAGWMGLG